MSIESTRPHSDDSQRLTFKDLGVSKSELEAENNVVNLDDYRNKKVELSSNEEFATDKKEKKNKLKPKAILLAGATMLGSYLMIQEAFSQKVAPIEVGTEKKQLDIEDIKVGDTVEVSAYDYHVTGGNVRTSPNVGDEGENIVKADLSDKVLVKPIKVIDSANSANGNWYVFYDSEGSKFAINEQNVVADNNSSNTPTESVTITETSSRGIIAHTPSGNTVMVAGVRNS